MRRALDELPPDEREVVRLSFLVGLTHPEIAERMGVPVGTVKSRAHRAHRRLASLLAHVARREPSGPRRRSGGTRTDRGRRPAVMSDEPMDGTDERGDDAATAAILAAFAPVLADEAVWAEPPAGARRLGARRHRRRAGRRLAGRARRHRFVTGRRGGRGRRGGSPRPRRSSPWSPSASSPPGTTTVAASSSRWRAPSWRAAPVAEATLTELGAGTEVVLEIEDLPPAPEGSYYQAWARSPDGELVSMGTFHMRDGDATVTLWSGVDPADFPTVTVTIQQLGAGPESSGQVVLRGSIDSASD